MKKYRLLGAFLAGAMVFTGIPAAAQPLSVSVSAASKLAAPTGIKAASTDKTIKLTWKAVKGADAYCVYMAKGYTNTEFEAVKTVKGTSCTLKDLSEQKTYKLKVAALVKTSKGYSKQTMTDVIEVATKMSAPKSITVSTAQSSVLLSWGGGLYSIGTYSGVYGYRVYKYDSKTGKYVKYKDVTSTSCLIEGLKEGTYYKFRVAALIKEGNKLVPQTQSGVITVTPSKSAKAELPVFPAYGKSSEAVMKEMGIKDYTVSSSNEGTVYMCGVSDSSLLLGSVSGGTLLLFDDSDRFVGGAYIASMSSFNVLSALEQLRAKNGKELSGSDSSTEMFFWQTDNSVELFQYGSGMAIYGSFGTKYMSKSMKEALNRSLEKINGKLSA